MKTLKLILIVLILFLASCRSRELDFARSKTSEIRKEKLSLNESRSEWVDGVRVVDIKDSSRQFVALRIYPLDTFSLSMNDGFRGRASVIEYWSLKERVSNGKDSSGLIARQEHTNGYAGEIEIRKDEASKSREVRKERMVLVGWIVIVGLGVFVLLTIRAHWKRILERFAII